MVLYHMRGSMNFCQGGGGGGVQARLPENSVDVLTYFTVIQRGSNGLSMVYFREDYNFPRFQSGSNIFQGVVVQLLPGGGGGGPIAYFYRNRYTL